MPKLTRTGYETSSRETGHMSCTRLRFKLGMKFCEERAGLCRGLIHR